MAAGHLPQSVPYLPASRPRQRLPAGAVDCHAHVFPTESDHLMAAGRSYTPAPASLDAYLTMCGAMGLTRTVQVNASVYGDDNRPTAGVIERLGLARARGVAGIRPDLPAAELHRLHEAGFRGVRLSTHMQGYGGTELLGVLAECIRPLGWHLQLHLGAASELPALERQLLHLPVPVVFDHLANIRGPEGTGCAAFASLQRLLHDRSDCWVKVSGWYRRSALGAPSYADMEPLVRALAAECPGRLLFGTNWPHPALFDTAAMPDDGRLVDLVCDWLGSDTAIRQAFVDNPAALYQF